MLYLKMDFSSMQSPSKNLSLQDVLMSKFGIPCITLDILNYLNPEILAKFIICQVYDGCI